MTICLTSTQVSHIKKAVKDGLFAFVRPEPMSMSEWADENFYLSSESSYVEGRWTSLPWQVAIMNAIGHDETRIVNFIKSARVGYSQMIRCALGYFTEHKARNQLLFQPTNGAAEDFMKAHIETMIRDVPVVKHLSPWYGKKHRDNTLSSKRFANGKKLWCLGGETPKNYRDKSVDAVYFDELAAFADDINGEGSATFLGDKRIEGSIFPKSIRGSTPKIMGSCQISKAADESEHFFRFHVPCPHCGHHQVLEWGDKETKHGVKWVEGHPESARYACIECGTLSEQREMMARFPDGIWKDGEYWTKDGLTYYKGKKRIDTPESLTFHIWTIYSPFTTWTRIVKEFLLAKDDRSKLKTFVNTTLGECWDDSEGEKIEPHALFMRREFYTHEIPVDDCVLTAAVDVQDDRLEVGIEAWVEGEENFSISYDRLYGNLDRPEIWETLYRHLSRTFETPNGRLIEIKLAVIDSGGHYTDEVYNFSKRYGLFRFIPIKGRSDYGKAIFEFPRKRTKKGVYLTPIGTDTAKEILSNRLLNTTVGPGFIHFPHADQFDETYFKHLTNERRKIKIVNGRRVVKWDAEGRRNEPWDLKVYNLAAIRMAREHFGVKLDKKATTKKKKATTKKKAKAPQSMIDLG